MAHWCERQQAALLLEVVELYMAWQAGRWRQRQLVLGPDRFSELRAVPTWSKAVTSETLAAARSSSRGTGWAPGGLTSAPDVPSCTEPPGAP